MGTCGNCKLGKRNRNTVYCTHYGISIRASFSGCLKNIPRIVEVEDVKTHTATVSGDVRELPGETEEV